MKQKSFFKEGELECPCCGKLDMDETFMLMLNNARLISDIPYIINSGCRCMLQNIAVKGTDGSSHLDGCAVDIHCVSPLSRFYIVNGLILAGFKRIGIYGAWIHADSDPLKPSSIWRS